MATRRSSLEIVRDNMRQMGFRFRRGQHAVKDDWPVYCRHGLASGNFGPYTYEFHEDGKLWQSYDGGIEIDTKNAITYVYDHSAIPAFDRSPKTIKNLSLRTKDRWLSNAWYPARQDSLRDVLESQRKKLIRWHSSTGEVRVQFTVGEIVDLLLDDAEVAARRQREQEYLQRPEIKRRLKAGRPIGFHERDLSGAQPVKTPAPRAPRAHVVWLPAQTNGFQHPNKARTVYPDGISRLALDHRKVSSSILRAWGTEPKDRVNSIPLVWKRIKKKRRWEANLSMDDAEKILL